MGGQFPPENSPEKSDECGENKAEKAENCKTIYDMTTEEKIAEKEGVEKAYKKGIISKFERDCRIDKLNLKGHKILLDRIMCKYHDIAIGGKQAALDRFCKDNPCVERHMSGDNYFVINDNTVYLSSSYGIIALSKNIIDLKGSVINFTDEALNGVFATHVNMVDRQHNRKDIGIVTIKQINEYYKQHKDDKSKSKLIFSAGKEHAYKYLNGEYYMGIAYDYEYLRDMATIVASYGKVRLYTLTFGSGVREFLIIEDTVTGNKAMLLCIRLKAEHLDEYKEYTFAQERLEILTKY